MHQVLSAPVTCDMCATSDTAFVFVIELNDYDAIVLCNTCAPQFGEVKDDELVLARLQEFATIKPLGPQEPGGRYSTITVGDDLRGAAARRSVIAISVPPAAPSRKDADFNYLGHEVSLGGRLILCLDCGALGPIADWQFSLPCDPEAIRMWCAITPELRRRGTGARPAHAPTDCGPSSSPAGLDARAPRPVAAQ